MNMDFRTVVKPLEHHSGLIAHDTGIFMLGSCFTDNIGRRLTDALFPVCANPFGTLYNPASIHRIVERIVSGTPFTEADIFTHGRMNHSFLCHSSLSSVDADGMLRNLNSRLEHSRRCLLEANTLIITLGTSWIYRLVSTGEVVANCHKLPAAVFHRELLTVDDVERLLNDTLRMVKDINRDITTILTVSPIRHLADGAHGNTISKATLQLGVDRVVNSNDNTIYYPAYEIVNDDLRDYRFYASDLCHPSDTAVDYIYANFSESFFSPATTQIARMAEKYTRRLHHRPLTDDEDARAEFLKATDRMRTDLINQYPVLKNSITDITI